MTHRPDSPQWLTAKAVGDRAEIAVAEWFSGRGYAVFKTLGLASFDLLLQTSVEVKHDQQAERTQNVAVEVECNGKPSGIITTEAAWWAFVIGSRAVIVKTEVLRELIRVHGFRRTKAGDNKGSVIALVSLSVLMQTPNVFSVPLTGVA